MEALKKCPFCGGQAETLWKIKTKHGRIVVFVQCSNCRVQSVGWLMKTYEAVARNLPKAVTAVVDKWNQRAVLHISDDNNGADNMDDLKSCPFCGGSASIEQHTGRDSSIFTFVRCSKCGAETRGLKINPYDQTYSERKTAIVMSWWNRRAKV